MEVAKVLIAVYDEDLENGVFRIPGIFARLIVAH